MIWGTLKPSDPVTLNKDLPTRARDKIVLHGLRDAGEPSCGEPIRLMLDMAEAKTLVESLQEILKAEGR